MILPVTERLYERMLNAFENDSGSPETDYRTIYIYHDGNGKRRQLTLGRGFTADGGSLGKVVDRYISKGGAQAAFMQAHRNLSPDDTALITMFHTVSTEAAMQEAQDEVFAEVYLHPAYAWAAKNGFVLPLSVGVIVDSYLHSGEMLSFLMNAFPTKKPGDGGDEKKWILSYLRERRAWLVRKGKPLSNTVYRPDFFLGLIAVGNWVFDCPLIANGSNIC